MVLTRAQAAAQAANQAVVQAANRSANQGAIQVHESSTETAIVEYPRSAQVQFIENFLSTNDQLARVAQQLIAQTQILATGQAMLHYQHQDQSEAHHAALVAVQQSTESSVGQLTDQQRVIAERIGEALVSTQAELQEQLQRLQVVDGDPLTQIEQYANEKFGLVLQEVQRETQASQLAIASQPERVRLRVEAIESEVASSLTAITSGFQHTVEERIAALRGDIIPEQNTALVKSMVAQASTAAAADIKTALEAELHRSQLTTTSQTAAFENKIARRLEVITSRIPQIVEEKIAASQDKGPPSASC